MGLTGGVHQFPAAHDEGTADLLCTVVARALESAHGHQNRHLTAPDAIFANELITCSKYQELLCGSGCQ